MGTFKERKKEIITGAIIGIWVWLILKWLNG